MSPSGILKLELWQLKLAGLFNPSSLSQSLPHQTLANAGGAYALGLLEGTATAGLFPAAQKCLWSWSLLPPGVFQIREPQVITNNTW